MVVLVGQPVAGVLLMKRRWCFGVRIIRASSVCAGACSVVVVLGCPFVVVGWSSCKWRGYV